MKECRMTKEKRRTAINFLFDNDYNDNMTTILAIRREMMGGKKPITGVYSVGIYSLQRHICRKAEAGGEQSGSCCRTRQETIKDWIREILQR